MPVPRRGAEVAKADGSAGKVKSVAEPKRRRQAMSLVCLECHGKGFTEGFMKQFDHVVELFNAKFGSPARAIIRVRPLLQLQPVFATCHSMSYAQESYRQSVHYNSGSGVRASCGDCHVPEGVFAATWDHILPFPMRFPQDPGP